MKKITIAIIFISVLLAITLSNVTLSNDSSNIKLKNVEALAQDEGGSDIPCTAPGGICMYFDKEHNPTFVPGLSLE